MELDRIVAVIKESRDAAILPHISADGDAVGSCLALALAMRKLGKRVAVFLEEEIPYIYGFLPGKELAQVYTTGAMHFDAVITLDTGDLGRLGFRREILDSARVTVNIDHHNTNSEFAFYNYVDTGSSAVGEIIYKVIKMLGLELDRDIAACLYVAITTDTGGFRFSNTTALTHRITADLLDVGVDVAEVSHRVFDSTSFEKLKLMAAAVDSLEIFEKGKIGIMTVTDEVMKQIGARDEDCDGIVNSARNIRGVEVAAFMRQWSNGEIKVNLRSNQYVDVSKIAELYSGGGHKRASGYIVKDSLEAAREKLLHDIREVL